MKIICAKTYLHFLSQSPCDLWPFDLLIAPHLLLLLC